IVAGPIVEQPDRDVEHMVNAVDVFRLFADLAEVDIAKAIPRGTDAQPVLPYLRDPAQDALRDINFTQGALNIQTDGGVNGPCGFGGSIGSHTPTGKNVCGDSGGTWWGKGADDPLVVRAVEHCWQVNREIYLSDAPGNYESNRIDMAATVYQAVRNTDYK